MTLSKEQNAALLRSLADTAIAAAQPARSIPQYLPAAPTGRTVVVAAGKAAAAMSRAFEDAWEGPLEGLCVTRYGHQVPCRRIEVIEASHPVPDQSGLAAARRIIDLASTLGEDDLLVFLLSGGASALLPLPAGNITLEEKQALTDALLRSGAAIDEINCVRRHVSAIKGGRLAAAAAPARIVTLAISDVPGDDPLAIGSGPTVADPTTSADALEVLCRYAIEPAESVRDVLSEGEPVQPVPNEYHLIATPNASLQAASDAAKRMAELRNLKTIMLGDALEGEARDVACDHAAQAQRLAKAGKPFVLLSGGEFTVTMKGNGKGGPNTEYLLSLALSLENQAGFSAIAVDTDGIDGSEDNAGAMIFADTLQRASDLGLDARAYLANNDAYSFFKVLDDLVMTGPTLTNVNDFRAILYDPR